MRKVTCTRMELLEHKAQIELAKQGRDLLEQKRTALLKEILHTADTVMERYDVLVKAAGDARKALIRAEAIAGSENVRSAAFASRADFPLQVTTSNVMGIRVPHIEQKAILRPAMGRNYATVGTSITIDEAATAYEIEVDAIVQLAESELRLKRLAVEIQRTTRRLNALEHLLIPDLEAERNFIQIVLDERERTDHFRFKLIKRIMERKRIFSD